MSKINSIIVTFSNLTCMQNFSNAEKIEDLEIWEKSFSPISLTLPLYLNKNAEESDYIEGVEKAYTKPPKHTERTDDLPDYSDIERHPCPTDKELEQCPD